jgi:predicted lipoprotein with Yx(FWY)xxD motif
MKTPYTITTIFIIILLIGSYFLFHTSNKEISNIPGTTSTSTPVGTQYISGNLLLGTDMATDVGVHLIGFNGRPLYAYNADVSGVSNCTGQCAANWPPYLLEVPSAVTNLQAGVTGVVDTLIRVDGGVQVTYDGKPLYFFIGDTTSGGVKGNGQSGFTVVKVTAGTPAPVVGLGAHCGGFIKNAHTCSAGLRCQLVISRPDAGGTCIKSN